MPGLPMTPGVQRVFAAARDKDPAVPDLSDAHVRGLLGGINELCVYHITWQTIETLPILHRTITTFGKQFLRP